MSENDQKGQHTLFVLGSWPNLSGMTRSLRLRSVCHPRQPSLRIVAYLCTPTAAAYIRRSRNTPILALDYQREDKEGMLPQIERYGHWCTGKAKITIPLAFVRLLAESR